MSALTSSTPRRSNRIAGIPAPAPLAPCKAARPKKAPLPWMMLEMEESEKMAEIDELKRSYEGVLMYSPFHKKWERLLDATCDWMNNVSSRLLVQSAEIRKCTTMMIAELDEHLRPIVYKKMHCLEQQVAYLPSHEEWADEIHEELETTRSLINHMHDALDRWNRMLRDIRETLPRCDNPFYCEK